MSKRFTDPRAYLDYLRGIYAVPYTEEGVFDAEFARVVKTQSVEAGIPVPEGPIAGLELAMARLLGNALPLLPAETAAELTRVLAVGVVEHGAPNAFIAKSPEGWFSILMHSGVMLFLHKYTKLLVAYEDPSCVIYCNRKDASEVTREDIGKYLDDTFHFYRDNDDPRGPRVKLTMEASVRAVTSLVPMEAFMLCHELGHFINGDLDDQAAYAALPRGALGQQYRGDDDHEIEYRADGTGFGVYLQGRETFGYAGVTPLQAFMPVCMLFEILHRLGATASATHPDPLDRAANIARVHFGDEFADQLAPALRDPSLLAKVLSSS